MAKATSKTVKTDTAQYRISLKEGEKIKVGGVTLRPDRKHVVSAAVFEANKSRIESHEAV